MWVFLDSVCTIDLFACPYFESLSFNWRLLMYFVDSLLCILISLIRPSLSWPQQGIRKANKADDCPTASKLVHKAIRRMSLLLLVWVFPSTDQWSADKRIRQHGCTSIFHLSYEHVSERQSTAAVAKNFPSSQLHPSSLSLHPKPISPSYPLLTARKPPKLHPRPSAKVELSRPHAVLPIITVPSVFLGMWVF